MDAYRIVLVPGRAGGHVEVTLCPLCAEHAQAKTTPQISEEPCYECGVAAPDYEANYSRLAPDYPDAPDEDD